MSSTDQSQRKVADSVLVVLTTWPDVEQARAASQALIGERLAACANILPGMESIYRWEGKVEANAEILVIFKTTAARYPALESRIRELHCYQVPEILALPVAAGLPAFLQWVEESCSTIQV